jgi:hypothetical protein
MKTKLTFLLSLTFLFLFSSSSVVFTSEYDPFLEGYEQSRQQEELKSVLKDAERRKQKDDFRRQLKNSLTSSNETNKKYIKEKLKLIEILELAIFSKEFFDDSKLHIMQAFESNPALFKDKNGKIMSPIQAAHYNCSKFFSTIEKSKEKEIYRQCKESGWSKKIKRQTVNQSSKKEDIDEIMRSLDALKVNNPRGGLDFLEFLKKNYFVFIMGFACPLIIYVAWKAVKWIGGRPPLNDQSDISSATSELDVKPLSINDGKNVANINIHESFLKHGSLWAASVIFFQLCIFAGLIFLLNTMATKELLKLSIVIAEQLFLVPFLLVCIYPSIRLNQVFLKHSKSCQPFAWGYFNSLAVITIGASGAIFGIWSYSEDGANLIIWSILMIALGALLYGRNRWAWIVFTILNVNPASWVINGIYLKNRWDEMKKI